MDEQQKINNDVSNVPAPIDDAPRSDEIMIVSDGELPSGAHTDTSPTQADPTTVYDAEHGFDSMRGGYASVNGSRVRRENKLIWIVIAIMTVMCFAVGICSAVVTARLVQRGETPPVISSDGVVQQNIAAVVTARKSSIAEVKCGGLSSSGIVMKRDGKVVFVLTNAHAIAQYVEGGSKPNVRFSGYDDYYVSDVKGYDSHYDVAVLAVTVNDDVAVFDIDGSDVLSPDVTFAEGDYVVSIGNAMGMGVSCYEGIISRKSELLECNKLFGESGKKTVPVFRTTAVINAGMSGGGVFDMHGRLVGLGTYRMSTSNAVNVDGDSSSKDVENTGFATPMSVVYPIYKRILASDEGEVALFTVNTQKSNSAVGWLDLPLLGFNCEYKRGKLTVQTVSDNSSAIKSGDVITKIGDRDVTDDVCGVTGAFLSYHRLGTGKMLVLEVQSGDSARTVTFDGFRYAI